jgi:hypothetical protein
VAIVDDHDIVAHHEVLVVAELRVEPNQDIRNAGEPDGGRDHSADRQREVHAVNPRHISPGQYLLPDFGALLRIQLDRAVSLALLHLALLHLALLRLRLRSLALLGLRLRSLALLGLRLPLSLRRLSALWRGWMLAWLALAGSLARVSLLALAGGLARMTLRLSGLPRLLSLALALLSLLARSLARGLRLTMFLGLALLALRLCLACSLTRLTAFLGLPRGLLALSLLALLLRALSLLALLLSALLSLTGASTFLSGAALRLRGGSGLTTTAGLCARHALG